MSIQIENLNKPDNKNWKNVSDFFLFTLPLYVTAIMAVPIPDQLKLWLNFGLTIIIVTIKGISKFSTNENTV